MDNHCRFFLQVYCLFALEVMWFLAPTKLLLERFKLARATDKARVLADYFKTLLESFGQRYVEKIEGRTGLEHYSIGHSCWWSELRFSQHKFSSY